MFLKIYDQNTKTSPTSEKFHLLATKVRYHIPLIIKKNLRQMNSKAMILVYKLISIKIINLLKLLLMQSISIQLRLYNEIFKPIFISNLS